MEPTPPETKKPAAPAAIGVWLAIGAGIGAALGVAAKDIGLWLPVGVGVGLALGVGLTRRRR